MIIENARQRVMFTELEIGEVFEWCDFICIKVSEDTAFNAVFNKLFVFQDVLVTKRSARLVLED